MDNEWDDDTPWADPEIRRAYEAALGKFILAYNQIDYYLSKILGFCKAYDEEKICNVIKGNNFTNKLQKLKSLSKSIHHLNLSKLPYDELEAIHNKRNAFAHGYMDQNPFDGSYDIIGKDGLDGAKEASIEALAILAKDAANLWDDIRLVEASYWFEEIRD